MHNKSALLLLLYMFLITKLSYKLGIDHLAAKAKKELSRLSKRFQKYKEITY